MSKQIEPVQDLVAKAVQNRPELAQTQLQIENAKISLAGSKSQLLPSLNLVASAQNNGLAGQTNSLLMTHTPNVRTDPYRIPSTPVCSVVLATSGVRFSAATSLTTALGSNSTFLFATVQPRRTSPATN